MNQLDQRCIDTLRILSADQVQQANSGHPGLPLGAAPMAYALFDRVMRHNPKDLAWPNRDRFVLSAGHGSALLYALLHLYGTGLTLEDLRNFRQFGSKTPGHPEYGHTPGVETTTGPLGQGVATAVGMAIAQEKLAAHFNRPGFDLVDHTTYALVGDGCLMEGISSEACSLAGTLKLGNLIMLYDSNNITIEGSTDIAFTEDVCARYEAYGWRVITVPDGNDLPAIVGALQLAKADARPALIRVVTKIGYGSPREGTASAHGEPLGADGLAALKSKFGFDPAQSFFVPDEVYAHAELTAGRGAAAQKEWDALLARYAAVHGDLYKEWCAWHEGAAPDLAHDKDFWAFEGKSATRIASGVLLNRLADRLPNLIGGSADLAPSTKTLLTGRGDFSVKNRDGCNLHYGVREAAMAAIANGIALHGGLHTYCATFFVFSDYMKGSMRLSALMGLPVIYVLTHDSIGVGEDGPTHEPIEQLAMLRAMPGLRVFRPADAKETAAAYACAMQGKGPCALVLTRQDLPLYANSGKAAMKGGYILSDCKGKPDVLLIATGSEVEQCMQAQELLKAQKIAARVVSLPCWELFEEQDAAYRESVLPAAVRARVAVEAASPLGWHRYAGDAGEVIAMEGFGASAPAATLFDTFGFTADNVAAAAARSLQNAGGAAPAAKEAVAKKPRAPK